VSEDRHIPIPTITYCYLALFHSHSSQGTRPAEVHPDGFLHAAVTAGLAAGIGVKRNGPDRRWTSWLCLADDALALSIGVADAVADAEFDEGNDEIEAPPPGSDPGRRAAAPHCSLSLCEPQSVDCSAATVCSRYSAVMLVEAAHLHCWSRLLLERPARGGQVEAGPAGCESQCLVQRQLQ
jgi:hypothetical protein